MASGRRPIPRRLTEIIQEEQDNLENEMAVTSSTSGAQKMTTHSTSPVLSPITVLAMTFGESAISTPTGRFSGPEGFFSSQLDSQGLSVDGSSGTQGSLMTSAFTLNSAEQSPNTRRAEQRARGAQRRLNIAPLRMSYSNTDTTTPEKQIMHTGAEEMSFYEGSSPQQSPLPCPIDACMESDLSPETSPARYAAVHPPMRRIPIEDDPNSVDSGFSNDSIMPSTSAGSSVFKFLTPSGLAPRKTPAKSSPTSLKMFHSLSNGSLGSADDEYIELFDMDSMDAMETQMPNDLSSLLSGDIKAVRNTPENLRRPPARRSLSLNEAPLAMRRARTNLFEMGEKRLSVLQPLSTNASTLTTPKNTFKRPEPPTISPTQSKRLKFESEHQENIEPQPKITLFKPNLLRKSHSMNEATIMTALARSHSEPNLIGDFSKPFCLPLIEGRHSDLKSISVETMAALLRGEFEESIASFKVIDCRYPYEFEGGHIRGAKNLYMQDQILEEFVNSLVEPAMTECSSRKRNILVFHCEFSSERGPKLSRFLRNNDRIRNTDSYPALHYPEIYLLHGGYKDFFAAHPDLCDPISYRPMLDPEYSETYKRYRALTRSASGDPKASGVKGTLSKTRSRLVL